MFFLNPHIDLYCAMCSLIRIAPKFEYESQDIILEKSQGNGTCKFTSGM